MRVRLEDIKKLASELRKDGSGKSHFDLLGVTQDSTRDDIRQAFRKLARDFHVDRFAQYGIDDEARRAIQAVFIAINRAHETLTNDEMRREYEAETALRAKGQAVRPGGGHAVQRALDAEKMIRSSLTLIKNAKYQTALDRLNEALEITNDDPLGLAAQAFAEFMVVQSRGNSPTAAGRAREKLEEVVKEMDGREEPFLYLGRVYRAQGKEDQAVEAFKKALQINQHCIEAASELRHLKRKSAEEQSKGIMGLFGRKKK